MKPEELKEYQEEYKEAKEVFETEKKLKHKEKTERDAKMKKQKELVEKAALLVSFQMSHPDNRVEYDIWFSSTDDRALDFISDFKEFHDKLGESKLLMTPHYVTNDCKQCETTFKQRECYGDGKYCAVDHKGVQLSGQEVMKEDLRQKCVYNSTDGKNMWWKYVKTVHQQCSDYINEDCSKNAHNSIGLDYAETEACMKKSFASGDLNDHLNENYALGAEVTYKRKYGAHFFPAIVINNRTYRGSFDSENVFESICAGFKNPPKVCVKSRSFTEIIMTGVTGTRMLWIVFGLILFNVVLIYCYRRFTKREMNEEMKMQVNSAVS